MIWLANRKKDADFDDWLRGTGRWIREQELATIPPTHELQTMFDVLDDQKTNIAETARRAERLIRRDTLFRNFRMAAATVVITISISFSALMVASPDARAAVRNLIVEWFERHTRFIVTDDGDITTAALPSEFRPTYVPEGFVENIFVEADYLFWAYFQHEDGAEFDLIIQTFVGTIDAFLASHEYRDFAIRIIDGVEYFVFEATDERRSNSIFWFYDNLHINLSAKDLPLSQLELIALSVQRQ